MAVVVDAERDSKGKIQPSLTLRNLYNKRVCSTKNEPQQQGISYVEREKEG